MDEHSQNKSQYKQLWLVAIADKGVVVYTKAYPDENAATNGLAAYLREYHQYDGPDDSQLIHQWLGRHDENLSVSIVCQHDIDDQTIGAISQVDEFLLKHGFVVLALNHTEPSPGAPYEAWAYSGPLDFQSATPITFGLGTNIQSTLEALNLKLQNGQTMTKETFSVSLKEQCADVPAKTVKVKILSEAGKIWIQPEGYSDKCSVDGHGYPIGLEIWQGRLRLIVFDNINVEEPQIIDLENAGENNRDSEDQNDS